MSRPARRSCACCATAGRKPGSRRNSACNLPWRRRWSRARLDFAELTDGFVRRPEVQAIFPRVSFDVTDATMEGSAFAPADSVEITTKSGETFRSGPVEYAKGSHQLPLSRGELFEKFADCLGTAFPEARKSRAFENLMMFDRLNSASDLGVAELERKAAHSIDADLGLIPAQRRPSLQRWPRRLWRRSRHRNQFRKRRHRPGIRLRTRSECRPRRRGSSASS